MTIEELCNEHFVKTEILGLREKFRQCLGEASYDMILNDTAAVLSWLNDANSAITRANALEHSLEGT